MQPAPKNLQEKKKLHQRNLVKYVLLQVAIEACEDSAQQWLCRGRTFWERYTMNLCFSIFQLAKIGFWQNSVNLLFHNQGSIYNYTTQKYRRSSRTTKDYFCTHINVDKWKEIFKAQIAMMSIANNRWFQQIWKLHMTENSKW